MKHDKKTAEAVKKFADEIAEAAKDYNFACDIDIDYEREHSSTGASYADRATITSDLGIVLVIPNFRKKSAVGTILNLGMINCMELEGYDEDYIERHGKIYGKHVERSAESAKALGYYLTHKLSFDKTRT